MFTGWPHRSRRRRELVLHIGSGKTGTSSIQLLMGGNRQRLVAAGWLYPRSPADERQRHARLGLFTQSDERLTSGPLWSREQAATPAHFRRRFREDLLGEISRSGLQRVLLSDEALYGSPPAAMARLRGLTDELAGRVRVVVYLRRQDDHLISRYQQVVKVGETRRLAERTRETDFSSPYDYHSRLVAWRRELGPEDVVVRRFEASGFVAGSLYQDFLTACGIELEADALAPVDRENESLDAEAVEFLRLLNLVHVEYAGGTPGGHINNRRHVLRLAGSSSGPVLTLPQSELDAFMAQWEASNAAVARDFLGEPAGTLFRSPRRTAHTTTVQVLDPDRLDHYVDLLELPGRLHEPLRRVAAREAGRG